MNKDKPGQQAKNNHKNIKSFNSENSQNQVRINQRLSLIKKYYNLDNLLAHGTKQKDIAKYYKKSDFFYNHIHSGGGGNIHMALSSNNTFDRADFTKQAEYVANFIKKGDKVLEVGAGQVSNSKYLAERFKDVEFTALDIPNRNFLKNKVPKNITLIEGDYHNLNQLEDGSFDVVFGIETICHSPNKQLVISELMKKLKPSGTFISFDVYEPKPRSKMSDFEKTVSSITLAGMRVTDKDQYIGDFKNYLKILGAKNIEAVNLTQNIVPNLKRLAKISKLYYTHPILVKILKILLPEDVTINSVAGFLMDLTFDGEQIHAYYRVTAKKSS